MREIVGLERGGFLLFLALVTLALLVVVLPFAQPLLWAALAAIMFQPLFRWFLVRAPGRDNQAALATLLVIFVAVIVPAFAIGSAVVNEAAGLVVAFFKALWRGKRVAGGGDRDRHEVHARPGGARPG